MAQNPMIPSPSLDALADDPDIQAAVKELALATIKWQTDIMRRGTASAKANVARAFGPLVAKAAASTGQTQTDELRAEFRAMLAEMAAAPPVPLPANVRSLRVDGPTAATGA